MSFVALLMCSMTCSVAWGQTPSAPSSGAQSAGQQQSMPGMEVSGMSGHDMSKMKDMPMDGEKDADTDASAHLMNSMEGHMDMGPHMKMTSLRQPKPGDAARAQQVAVEERFSDYHAALADGFEIFRPEIRQKMYHFTNKGYAREAFSRFNPEHPTSLFYEKQGDDYKLIGVMYSARKRLTEEQLDERIPLSVAQWHEHVNFCAPPADKRRKMLAAHPPVWFAGIDDHAGSLRRRRWNISSHDIQLDGAPLSVRERFRRISGRSSAGTATPTDFISTCRDVAASYVSTHLQRVSELHRTRKQITKHTPDVPFFHCEFAMNSRPFLATGTQ